MEAKKETYANAISGMTRPALILDMAAFDSLMKTIPLLASEPELAPFRIMVRHNHFAMPVIRSPFLLSGYQEDKPSILHDFDRWFTRAQSRAEQSVYMARVDREEKSRNAMASCWRE